MNDFNEISELSSYFIKEGDEKTLVMCNITDPEEMDTFINEFKDKVEQEEVESGVSSFEEFIIDKWFFMYIPYASGTFNLD